MPRSCYRYPQRPEVAVTDQFVSLFVPEPERKRFETGEESDWLHGLEERIREVAFLEVVIRNSRAQMVNVVKADVAREPLQHPR